MNAANEAIAYYGSNSPENRLLVSLENVPLDATGQGRASLFGSKTQYSDKWGHEMSENAPGKLSSYLKVSPQKQDALYISVSPEVMREYAYSWSNPRPAMGARVRIPNEPIKESENLVDFYERSNFQLYAGESGGQDVVSGRKPMSNFQLFEEPYRLQTGRSLQSDMAKEWSGHKMSKVSHSAFLDDPIDVDQLIQQRESLQQLGQRFDIDFSTMYPEIVSPNGNKGVLANKNAAAKLGDIVFLYEHDGGTGLGLSISDARDLADNGFISKKIFNLYKNLNNRYYRTSLNKPRLLSYSYTDINDWAATMKKQKDAIAKFTNTYILNKNTLLKAKKRYFDAVKPTYELNKEYIKYLNDPKNVIEFMRSKGVAPLYEMPSFGKTEVFSTNHQAWGYKPKTRAFAPSTNASQGIIIGNKGEKLLNAEPYTEQDLLELLSGSTRKYGKYRSGARDAGKRYAGEEPKFAVTRKTFSSGGKLQQYADFSGFF